MQHYIINHTVKSHPKPFSDVWNGEKNHEIRINDSAYGKEEIVKLQEFNPDTKIYSGRSIDVLITYIRSGGYGLMDGYCVFDFIVLDHHGISHKREHSRYHPLFPIGEEQPE